MFKLFQGYWVSAIAARPSSTHKGYLLGGLVWFAVPFSLATSLGLGALALDLPITESEASHGLVPPATAIALMGKGGVPTSSNNAFYVRIFYSWLDLFWTHLSSHTSWGQS